ncbi:MAG TPA: hypothetical protein VHH09_05340 [Acidimicrobiales bacterium]|nr:hypothetical protein [Acidimicrobiales bacterium]
MPRLIAWVRSRDISPAALITLAVVAAAVLFTFLQLQPSLLFKRTTPAGGDTGAHVWGPDFLRTHLLGKGRITGWAPAWYAGFPAYVFYFPAPALLIALLSFLLPYGIAFKLVTVLGILTLPVAAWAFGRLSGMRFPGPALLAVMTVPFLFYSGFAQSGGSWSYTIYGGNIASTLAGEFSFSISLSLALLFLGVLARGLDTGRHQALAAVLLALTGLSHILPTLFALAGAAVILLLRPGVARLKFTVTLLGVGGLLAMFWVLPFYKRLPYTNNMGWEKLTEYQKNLFPSNLRWIVALAAAGAVGSLLLRRRTGAVLVGLALIAGAVFVFAPPGRLWNARALPFWYLCLFLLAGVALAEAGGLLARLFAADPERPDRRVELATPVVAALAAWIYVGSPLGVLPRWAPEVSSSASAFIPAWARWNYSGYEGKARYPEYKGVVDTMRRVGRTNGCGRAHWEYESGLNDFGTPMALMLLPYWTDQCIGSMEGLYFESSPTVPYHFLTAAELSKAPSNPQRDLPYRSLDVASGVRDLQLLGARYYLAFSPEALAQARANPDLRPVAESGRWQVFEVAGSELVAPLSYKPVVLEGVDTGHEGWLDVGVNWFSDPGRRAVPFAASGPDDWPRAAVTESPSATEKAGSNIAVGATPLEAVTPARVSNIRETDDRISFDVDRVGSPVLVKTSYFPNWQASGAKGPWRVTPNLMVVVPTSRHVELHYGYTPVDIGGWLLTIAGVGLVAFLAGRRRVDFQDRVGEDEEVAEPSDAEPEAAVAAEAHGDPATAPPSRSPVGAPERGS